MKKQAGHKSYEHLVLSLFIGLFVTLLGSKGFCLETYVLNYNQTQYISETPGILYLGTALDAQYGISSLQGLVLKEVIINAKSQYGSGTAALMIDGTSAASATVPGTAANFSSTAASTFYNVTLDNAAGNTGASTWQIYLTGNFVVSSVTLSVDAVAAATAKLSASPTSITSGSSSTLTYSSTNATKCTGTGFTASGTSGTVSVKPTATTTYSISCSNDGGSALASATVVVSSSSQPYPRLGTYSIGGQPGSAYNLAWANFLAAHSVNIISGYKGTGSAMYGGSRQSFVAEVKALTPPNINAAIFEYYITDSGNENGSPPAFDMGQVGLFNLMAANPNWWAWTDAQTKTTHVLNTYNSPPWWQTNQTIAAGKNSTGLYFEEAAAQNQYQFYWSSVGGADEASNMDGLYHDNFSLSPEVAFDYNSSGSVTAATNADFIQSLQQGMATGPNWFHANTSKMMIGNVATWGAPGKPAISSSYVGILNGGVFEGAFGETWSTYTGYSAGWAAGYPAFQKQYSTIMANMAAPAYVILGGDNLSSTGTDPYQSAPYAAMRFGLTATLVNGNGYYFGNSSYAAGVVQWFDEYAANASGVCPKYSSAASVAADLGYMGYPTSTFGSVSGTGNAVEINGLWTRMFYNATTGKTWAVINSPPGSGSLTIKASSFGRTNFKMLTGTQAPSVNNGATVTSITVPAGYDGRIVQLL